jgi:redox-sensitive bicupin YhaK (pirin superfamily)
MMRIRRSEERGRGSIDWLQSWFTFSFDQYRDPAHMHWGCLRVINEDIIAPGMGFGMHPHRDMEIISFVISGALRHQDSLGNTAILKPGEIQRMSAGSGIMHSEFNPDTKTPTHMLQIWILPSEKNRPPSWEQIRWTDLPETMVGLKCLASPHGIDGSATLGQEAAVWHARHHNAPIHLPLKENQKYWLQVATGTAVLNGGRSGSGSGSSGIRSHSSSSGAGDDIHLHAGDGLAVSDESILTITSSSADFSALWFHC